MIRATISLVVFLASVARSQEVLWQVATQTGFQYTNFTQWYGDLNHDGYEDLLTAGWDNSISYQPRVVRVLSGADGSVLESVEANHGLSLFEGVGDFNGDGYPDWAYMYICGFSTAWVFCLDVWSMHPPRLLINIPGIMSPGGNGGAMAGNLDCTGDGLPDLIIQLGGQLSVYDHFGALYYSIPTLAYGFTISDIEGVGDLDGDNADDFIIGGNEFYSGVSRGAVILISGRTGTPLRIHWGPQPWDILNRRVMPAGDMDGDGVGDYAGGNLDGFSGLVMVWSGATGAVIREWREQVGSLSGAYIPGRDVDLDGRPDIIDIAGAYLVMGPPWVYGRARALSSRDGQDLVQFSNVPGVTDWGWSYGDLGVQPGNPYPVFAIMDRPITAVGWQRIRAVRCSPVGTSFVGQGCTSAGAVPTIGVRRVAPVVPATVDTSRIVLGSAPADALALCVVAPFAATAGGGVTVPTQLDPLGMPGCTLLVPPVITALRLTGSSGMDRGYAALDLATPLVAAGGTRHAAQWVVLEPLSLSYAVTARYEFRVP